MLAIVIASASCMAKNDLGPLYIRVHSVHRSLCLLFCHNDDDAPPNIAIVVTIHNDCNHNNDHRNLNICDAACPSQYVNN